VTAGNVDEAISPVRELKPPFTFRDLRRSYGSLLINRGAEAEVIQELLGTRICG